MVDVVTPDKRSRMMSGIRNKDTRPEMMIRKGLHAMGLRFRLHAPRLPGKPDIVFPKYRAVIFVHGCFWHGHGCHLFKWPSTRRDFWKKKITRNKEKDGEVIADLQSGGWRVLVVMECALKGRKKKLYNRVIAEIFDWLTDGKDIAYIEGLEID